MIRFKDDHVREEFAQASTFLCEIVAEFERLSEAEGVIPVMTRAWERVVGSSGVHEAKRAVDFRDESPKGQMAYTHDQRVRILAGMNRRYVRRDGKPTCLWHSFRGGLHHFHVQVAPFMSAYVQMPGQASVAQDAVPCPHCRRIIKVSRGG